MFRVRPVLRLGFATFRETRAYLNGEVGQLPCWNNMYSALLCCRELSRLDSGVHCTTWTRRPMARRIGLVAISISISIDAQHRASRFSRRPNPAIFGTALALSVWRSEAGGGSSPSGGSDSLATPNVAAGTELHSHLPFYQGRVGSSPRSNARKNSQSREPQKPTADKLPGSGG
ncbi:hypothetical protein CALCODRAFT_287903 [Calocera cornea HHB12733]|uniref:Uncharacterized protein n=1 Tax=Calocera cornea HHB12733 TaxID=1353952 RepID=A0A165FUQ4_9BASI|nr:hypothetical protein CALCODRAFT_287903 [Calocera cornea HHB12733]